MGYAVQTALLGRPIGVPFGRVRISGNVIWTGGWVANAVIGGKGNKGKGGSQQYDYVTNVLIGLGAGRVQGVYNIWKDKDQFNLAFVQGDNAETYTVPSGGGTYTTQHGGIGKPEWWVLDVGVARQDAYTFSANDYGSPAVQAGSGNYWKPMKLVPSSPSAGEYTLTADSTGYAKYGFSAADHGQLMQINYSYMINNFSTVGSPMVHLDFVLFSGDLGQAPWSGLLNDPRFVSQALGYSQLAYIACPKFDLGSAGVISNLNFELQGRCGWGGAICDCNPADMIREILTNPLDGVLGWSTPGTGTAMVVVTVGGLGDLSGYSFTITSGVYARLLVGQGINVNGTGTTIAAIAGAVLTLNDIVDPYEQGIEGGTIPGCFWSATVLQSQSVVTGSSVWLPALSDANGIGSGGQVFKYCAANSIFLSHFYDQSGDARTILNDLLDIGNADAFWSEGMLKFGSYGDTTAAGNGVIYSPATQPIYDIDDSDMVCGSGEAPIKGPLRPDVLDVKNEIAVEWTNRAASYATNVLAPAQDAASVAQYGRRPDSTKSCPAITSQATAQLVQNAFLKRAVYITGVGTYEATVFPHFALLDPMDLCTFIEPYLNFDHKPLRITRIEEDDNCCLKLTLEEFPWSCSAPTRYPAQGHLPTQAGYFAAPGHVNTPMFVQLPSEFTQGNPNVLGIALSGAENWGGAAMFVSTDGVSYDFVGMATGAATTGSLTDALAASADPDTTSHALKVSLTLCGPGGVAELPSYTQQQADANVSLIAVESELLSYKIADLTGTYQYSLTYLRRGVYGTVNSAHPANSQFCVIDSGLYQYAYPASAIGKTLYFKFCSVNQAGKNQEDIGQVVEYSCFIGGPLTLTPFPWAPGFEAPNWRDPLVKEQTFALVPVPGTSFLNVIGNPPLNAFSSSIVAPILNSVIAVQSGGVKWVSVSDGGSGYLKGLSGQFPLTFASGSAAGYAVVVAGVVVNAIVTDGGSGYSGAPAVSFVAGAGIGATGTAHLSTGGTVGVGTYVVGVSALDAVTNAHGTPLSNLVTVTAASGSSEIIVNVTWPTGSYGGNVYVAESDPLHPFHYEWAPDVGTATSGVANYSITDILGTYIGAPDQRFNHLRLRTKRDIHAGVWAEQCSSVGATGARTITFAGATFTTNQWANRYISLLAFADQTQPLIVWNAQVLSNTADTLTLTSASPDPAGVISPGDLIVMRFQPSSISATQFSDTGAINCFETGGFSAGAEGGNVAWILLGPGAGQQRLIQTNEAGAGPITLATPWDVPPTADSLIIITESAWSPTYDTHPAPMNSYASWDGLVAMLELVNIENQPFIIQVLTVNENGDYDETYAPVREIFMPGQAIVSPIQTEDINITADHEISFPEVDGAQLSLHIVVRAHNPVWVVTWGAMFKYAPSVPGDVLYDLATTAYFVGIGGFWVSQGSGVIGVRA